MNRMGKGGSIGEGGGKGAESKKSEPVQGLAWRKQKQVIQAGSYLTPAWQRYHICIGEFVNIVFFSAHVCVCLVG